MDKQEVINAYNTMEEVFWRLCDYYQHRNPGTTVLETRDSGPGDQETSVAITFPVKNQDYYQVDVSGAGGTTTTTINFVPLS